MPVSKYATQAGKKYESDLVKFLREQGHDTERLRLSGAEDEGDVLLRLPSRRYVVEAKRRKSFDLGGWVAEAAVERGNYCLHRGLSLQEAGFVVVHYRRQHGIAQSYVTTTLREWLDAVSGPAD